jgi:putative Ca2+/H+ antiporter (TMEM165/GDT1 family)
MAGMRDAFIAGVAGGMIVCSLVAVITVLERLGTKFQLKMLFLLIAVVAMFFGARYWFLSSMSATHQ